MARLNLPTDIIAKIAEIIHKEGEKILKEKKYIIIENINNAKQIIETIKYMSYPEMFNDYLTEDLGADFNSLGDIIYNIEKKKRINN